MAKLAEAEGLMVAQEHYINAANMILVRAHLLGLRYLPKQAVKNMRLWVQEADKMMDLCTIKSTDAGLKMTLVVREMVAEIGALGQLPEYRLKNLLI